MRTCQGVKVVHGRRAESRCSAKIRHGVLSTMGPCTAAALEVEGFSMISYNDERIILSLS